MNSKNVNNFISKVRRFGLLLPLTNIIILYGERILGYNICKSISDWRHKTIRKKLSKILSDSAQNQGGNKFPKKKLTANDNNTIWTCWLQGEDSMPEILKTCLQSIRKFSNNHPAVFITLDNYSQYVTLPEHIIQKFQKGIISPTHFSDVLRVSLINQRGGAWIDVTLLLTAPISESFFSSPFYSIKNKPYSYYVSKCKWTGFCFGGMKNNAITSKVQTWLYLFWEKNDIIIDYFMLDYLFEKAYREEEEAQNVIDSIPFSNPNIGKLNNILEQAGKEKYFTEITQDTSIFKLSWKNHTPALYSNKDNLYHFVKQALDLK